MKTKQGKYSTLPFTCKEKAKVSKNFWCNKWVSAPMFSLLTEVSDIYFLRVYFWFKIKYNFSMCSYLSLLISHKQRTVDILYISSKEPFMLRLLEGWPLEFLPHNFAMCSHLSKVISYISKEPWIFLYS